MGSFSAGLSPSRFKLEKRWTNWAWASELLPIRARQSRSATPTSKASTDAPAYGRPLIGDSDTTGFRSRSSYGSRR